VQTVQAQFSRNSGGVIRQAVIDANKEIEPSEDREKVMQRAALKLR
jgi:hypothetical protein